MRKRAVLTVVLVNTLIISSVGIGNSITHVPDSYPEKMRVYAGFVVSLRKTVQLS